MTMDTTLAVLSQGTAIGVLVGAGWFIAFRVWPWWDERDDEERQRRHELRLKSSGTDEAIALALSSINYAVTNPIAVVLVEPDQHYKKLAVEDEQKRGER